MGHDFAESGGYSHSRRRVLGMGAAVAGWSLLPGSLALAAEEAGGREGEAIRKRPIPGTNELLPVMGLGSSGAFEGREATKMDALRRVMESFVELGGTVLDTSPSYGNAEANIGRLARETGVRDQLFMATKVRSRKKEAGLEQIAQSAELLGEPIDLMQIHNFIGLETQWRLLRTMRGEGRLRYIGLTHFRTSAFEQLEQEMKSKDMDFVQFNYSVMTPEAEERLLPLAADRGIAVIVNRAFNDGRFFQQVRNEPLPGYAAEFDCTSWAQFALKYVLSHPAVTVVIPATSDPEHLMDNMQAGYGALPDEAMRRRMRETMASL
ncbi:aldo/keto reductase [Fodinicurvata halophila]|uniref:Aldo/keto reductase n=1 Tax=Fodinicurvata halophila TaxID=1419723 RepID=A0ABV8UIJ8_9PROT